MTIKNVIIFLSFLLFISVFLGCSFFSDGKKEISSLNFSVKDNSESGTNYSEANIFFKPDYELRTLTVNYSLIFPYKTEDENVSNISTEGVIGGEFFDRFEEILDATSKDIWNTQKDAKAGTFLISIEKKNGDKKEYDLYTLDDKKVFELIENFYLDVIDLFSKDVY